MSVTSPSREFALKAAAVLVLWLASVSVSVAMPISRSASAKSCDAQTLSLRKLVTQARLGGGSLAKRLRHAGIRLSRQTTAIRLAPRASVRDDVQAIQNDAPVAPLGVDLKIELRPLGVFSEATAAPLDSRALSPRSPRGPPTGASHGFRSVAVSSNRGDRCEWLSLT